MVPLTYRCPETGQQVQGWAADDLIGWDSYEPVTCTACGRDDSEDRECPSRVGADENRSGVDERPQVPMR
jgi:hypothetical protein